jgi:hypothetical protein
MSLLLHDSLNTKHPNHSMQEIMNQADSFSGAELIVYTPG